MEYARNDSLDEVLRQPKAESLAPSRTPTTIANCALEFVGIVPAKGRIPTIPDR
jgi:hypothetical protein